MKLAISAKGKTLDSEIDPRFGRSGYFLIVIRIPWLLAIENKQNLQLPGAGIQTAQTVAEGTDLVTEMRAQGFPVL
jgi:predicted Fe-Mo cluster-binding NifX family protein